MGSRLWWQLRCKIYICGGAATTISHFSFLVQVKISNAIKERYARGLTLTPEV